MFKPITYFYQLIKLSSINASIGLIVCSFVSQYCYIKASITIGNVKFMKLAHLVLMISTGMEAMVVTRPEIIEAQKCSRMPSDMYAAITSRAWNKIFISIHD